MEEDFELTNDNVSYTVRVYDVQINNLTAFAGKFQKQGDLQYIHFKDHNEMIYYFTDKEMLKNRIFEFLSDLTSTSDAS